MTAAINIALSYLLGSLCGSLLLGRLRGVDIRSSGSGNPGGTNALRTQGWGFALAVVVIDVGKGALAVAVVAGLELAGPARISLPAMQALCALAAIVGHMFPIYYGFRGGKGAGTWAGTLLVLSGAVVTGVFVLWLIVLALTGYVGLATMLAAAASVPLAVWLDGVGVGSPYFFYYLAAALLIIAAHQSNIRKMVRGRENRFEKVRIIRWFRSPPDE